MRNKATYLFFLLTVLSLVAGAQSGRLSNWCFGNGAGVSFNTGAPVAFSGSAISTSEGCASISNTGGQLLFYTDGESVWDRTHALMPNADGTTWNKKLTGDGSSAHSAIITTHPCDTNKYYIFTTDGGTSFSAGDPKGSWDGVYYTVIDMTLNGGKGDVDLAYLATQTGYIAGANKISLVDSVQEKVNAAIHSNGVNYWIVAQRKRGDFRAFLVDCDGIDNTPVISNTTFATDVSYANMAFSADGKCLVVCGGPNWSVHMFDFNNTTGVITNKQTLVADQSELGAAWGVAFSPNDSNIFVVPWAGSKYKKFKRFAPSVPASGVIVNLPNTTTVLQLAPDGKIYATNNTDNSKLSAFTTPNNFANPGFVSNAVTLSNGTSCSYGLPTMFNGIASLKKKEFVRSDTAFCTVNPASIALGKDSLSCFNYDWAPAANLNNPASSNPIASIAQTTTFTVSVSSSCTTYVDTVKITVETCEESAHYFPNAFTPNNDGLNDLFKPVFSEFTNKDYLLMIFNRWGDVIFSTNDITQGWNGRYKDSSKDAQQDVYVYKLFAIDKYGIELEKVGHVSLVR